MLVPEPTATPVPKANANDHQNIIPFQPVSILGDETGRYLFFSKLAVSTEVAGLGFLAEDKIPESSEICGIPRNASHFWNKKFLRNFYVSECQKPVFLSTYERSEYV